MGVEHSRVADITQLPHATHRTLPCYYLYNQNDWQSEGFTSIQHKTGRFEDIHQLHTEETKPNTAKANNTRTKWSELKQNNTQKAEHKLECGPMPNVMDALPNIGGALCSMPQSLADAHY